MEDSVKGRLSVLLIGLGLIVLASGFGLQDQETASVLLESRALLGGVVGCDCDVAGTPPAEFWNIVNCGEHPGCACPAALSPVSYNFSSGTCIVPKSGKTCTQTLHEEYEKVYTGTCPITTEGCPSSQCSIINRASGSKLEWYTCVSE